MSWGLTLEEAVRFHGHLGPWLVVGYKVGELAKRLLNPKDYNELKCTVRIPRQVPFTCSIDGVQASTSCTLGKMNLAVEDGEDFEYVFTKKSTGETVRLKVKKEVVERVKSLVSSSVEEAAKYVMELEPWAIFELA